jgi:hypothetical protein
MPARIDATRLAERVRANQRTGQRRHRQRLAESGLTQIAVWIPVVTRQRLDAISAESGQTLSELATAALSLPHERQSALLLHFLREDPDGFIPVLREAFPDASERLAFLDRIKAEAEGRERRDAELDARIAATRAAAQRAVERQRTEAAAAGLLLPGVNITDPIFDREADNPALVSGLDSGSAAAELHYFSDAEIAHYSGQPLPEPPRRHTGGKPAIPDDIVHEVRLLHHREGWSFNRIADHLRISASSVSRIIKRGA